MKKTNLLKPSPEDWSGGQLRHGYRWRSARLSKNLGASRIGGTLYDLAEGERTFPYHFHHGTEEWLIVVEGTPTLRQPGGWVRQLRAGDVVCFPAGPEGAHQLTGEGVVLLVSADVVPDTAEYPDSGKVGALPPGKTFRADDAVDYWEGETIEPEAAR